jgi:hypothetical protein
LLSFRSSQSRISEKGFLRFVFSSLHRNRKVQIAEESIQRIEAKKYTMPMSKN